MIFLILIFHCLSFFACSNAGNQDWAKVAEIEKNIIQPVFPERDFLVTDYGAVNDSTVDSRDAIIKAINLCNFEGGGRVVIPPGVYLSKGPIHLKSNVHLYLSEESRLEFGTEVSDYLPAVLTRFEGTELFSYSPFIYAYQGSNIAITGQGVIDGNARRSFVPWKHKQGENKNTLRQMGNDNIPVYKRVMGEGYFIRPSMIQPYGCKNVLIEGITIVDSPFWVVHPVFCHSVTVKDITIDSWNYNNDGVDPDGCTNVLIENCTFNCGDDAIAIKSGRDQDGWRIGQATENVIIRNCKMNSKTNGLCIGSEMSGSVRNVFMENCQVGEAHSTIYFKANLDRGGMIENIFVRNITVKRAMSALIRFESNYKGHRGNYYPTLFRNFTIEDIQCKKADKYGIYAVGIKDTPIQDVIFRDITVDNVNIPTYSRYTSDIRFENVLMDNEQVTTLKESQDSAENITW